MRSQERGVLLAAFGLWLAVALVCCALVVGVANRAALRAGAQAAADATALAGAADGQDAAEAIASANGAVITSYENDGEAVTVRVERQSVAAVARAEKQIRPATSG